jgi:hypothetical protein
MGSARIIRRALHSHAGAAALLMLGASAAQAAPLTEHFGNATIGLEWDQQDGHLGSMQINDRANRRAIHIVAPFALTLADGERLTPAELVLAGPPRTGMLPGDPRASRLAERKQQSQLELSLMDRAGRFRVDWCLTQPVAASYLRETVTVTALKADESIARIDLFDAEAPDAEVVGRVNGSPVAVDRLTYFQFESPLAQSLADIDKPTIAMWLDRTLPLRKGKSVSYSAAVGSAPPGQLRRAFQAYLEDQRAHPYRPFLHYNSWYDIGYDTEYTQAQALDRIKTFCRELSAKRGVTIDSFLFDAGWDDLKGSWNFSPDFPNGFVPLKEAAQQCSAAPGVWLSPWGGYDTMKIKRIAGGRDQYEMIDGGFALSGPKYYARFHDVTMDLVTKNGVNQFKFDGFGNANHVVPGSAFDSDYDAAISLIGDLRRAKPDLFVNLTIGTYPSPAWLRYADTIFHGGQDHAFTGVGPSRERWITYRDQQTYENIVVSGPLFPLNSVMLHGIIYARYAAGLSSDPGNDFANDVHAFFGTGTELQELYITPSLLTAQNWDTLAEASRWSRANAAVLRDTHWIGGDPGRLEPYGWGAWSPAKSIVTLRNPGDRPQSFLLDLSRALELPRGSAQRYTTTVRWPAGAEIPKTLDAQRPTPIALRPFEVLTLELIPTA